MKPCSRARLFRSAAYKYFQRGISDLSNFLVRGDPSNHALRMHQQMLGPDTPTASHLFALIAAVREGGLTAIAYCINFALLEVRWPGHQSVGAIFSWWISTPDSLITLTINALSLIRLPS